MRELDSQKALYFRREFQQARDQAFRDAEAFEGIIHVVERMGCYIKEETGVLGRYVDCLTDFAKDSALAETIPSEHRTHHIPFGKLYQMVKDARNDAMHTGAFARHLTVHAVELALVLEDALEAKILEPRLCDYMVRNPVCAELWQPVSFVRQQMLVNSFSYLPIRPDNDEWKLISDREIARYLRSSPSNEIRKQRLAKKLSEAINDGDAKIELGPKVTLRSDETLVVDMIKEFNGNPVLLYKKNDEQKNIVGILTAFDLL